MDDFIECALSGLTPNDNEYADDVGPADDKDLVDIPVGWTEVRLRRRIPNPEYDRLMAVKDAMVAQALGQVPRERRRRVRGRRPRGRRRWSDRSAGGALRRA